MTRRPRCIVCGEPIPPAYQLKTSIRWRKGKRTEISRIDSSFCTDLCAVDWAHRQLASAEHITEVEEMYQSYGL